MRSAELECKQTLTFFCFMWHYEIFGVKFFHIFVRQFLDPFKRAPYHYFHWCLRIFLHTTIATLESLFRHDWGSEFQDIFQVSTLKNCSSKLQALSLFGRENSYFCPPLGIGIKCDLQKNKFLLKFPSSKSLTIGAGMQKTHQKFSVEKFSQLH